MVTPDEQRELLKIARDSIAAGFRPSQRGGVPRARSGYAGTLAEPHGAFVTLHIGLDLRGCIGYIMSDLPLADVVAEVAGKAAFEDPRFPPLTPEELDRITIEVSILSPLVRVNDIREIEVGRHGLLLELGRNRGLLLPQVAVENAWDRDTFLDYTARKAGLPRDAWREPEATIYMFTAEIIQEPTKEPDNAAVH